jgi:hypothetical protein
LGASRLFVFPSAMRFATVTMFCCGVGCRGVTCRAVTCFNMTATVFVSVSCIAVRDRAVSAIGCIATISVVTLRGAISAGAHHVSSSSGPVEAMPTPAVAISPVRPGTDAQEDTVVEITRPVIAPLCATVGRIVVIAPGTDRRSYSNPDADADLCLNRRHQDQGHEQGGSAGQKQTTHREPVSPQGHALDLPHLEILRNVSVESNL